MKMENFYYLVGFVKYIDKNGHQPSNFIDLEKPEESSSQNRVFRDKSNVLKDSIKEVARQKIDSLKKLRNQKPKRVYEVVSELRKKRKTQRTINEYCCYI